MTAEAARSGGGPLPTSAAAVAVVSAVVAIVAVALVIDPIGPSLHDPDAAATVLYFDRIAGGQRLEAFVPTTPKPLLTLLYGAAWEVFRDWRLLGLLTLAAFGVAVGAAAALVARVAGIAAAAFVVVALVASSEIVAEVAHANSVVWGLACWAIAGLALAHGPRRAWIVGLALAGAASFRNESYVLVALATVGVGGVILVRGRDVALRWSPVLLGWLALPLAVVHDLLRTGDPFSWVRVPAGYTAITTPGLRPTRPLEFASDVAGRFGQEPLLVALAIVGIAWLVWRRNSALAAGLLGLTIGVTALIGFVAWRGVYVTPRYFEQVDLGLIGAASIGVGAIARAAARRVSGGAGAGPPWATAGKVIGAVGAVVVALLVTLPTAPFDSDLAARLATGRAQSANVELVLPALRDAVAADTTVVPRPIAGPAGLDIVDPSSATLLVPRPLWTRLALELDVPLTRLADSWLAIRDSGALTSLRAGQTVYHDRAADAPPELFEPLELDARVVAGAIALEPVIADDLRGIWLLRVVSATAGS